MTRRNSHERGAFRAAARIIDGSVVRAASSLEKNRGTLSYAPTYIAQWLVINHTGNRMV